MNKKFVDVIFVILILGSVLISPTLKATQNHIKLPEYQTINNTTMPGFKNLEQEKNEGYKDYQNEYELKCISKIRKFRDGYKTNFGTCKNFILENNEIAKDVYLYLFPQKNGNKLKNMIFKKAREDVYLLRDKRIYVATPKKFEHVFNEKRCIKELNIIKDQIDPFNNNLNLSNEAKVIIEKRISMITNYETVLGYLNFFKIKMNHERLLLTKKDRIRLIVLNYFAKQHLTEHQINYINNNIKGFSSILNHIVNNSGFSWLSYMEDEKNYSPKKLTAVFKLIQRLRKIALYAKNRKLGEIAFKILKNLDIRIEKQYQSMNCFHRITEILSNAKTLYSFNKFKQSRSNWIPTGVEGIIKCYIF